MNNNVKSVLKTESKVIAYIVICLVIIVLGISYALFFQVKKNEKNQIVKAGTLEFSYENGSEITIEGNEDCFIPTNYDDAIKHSECEYKVSITNSGTLPGVYSLTLKSIAQSNPVGLDKLKVILKKEGTVENTYPKKISELNNEILVENEKIPAGGLINYTVQVFVDEETVLATDDEKAIALQINGRAEVSTDEGINPEGPKAQFPGMAIPLAEEGKDGLYAVRHNNLSELGSEWNKTEYRYAGVNPNNYVLFNNEKWRIIGLVNVKTTSGVEQRIKIIRTNGIEGQKDFGNYAWDKNTSGYSNNWTTSKLKDMLNGIYYNSGSGECYTGSNGSTASQSECDFSGEGELPKGLDDTARQMLDNEVIWNIGGWSTGQITADTMYEKERGTNTGSSNAYPAVWTKENDTTYHNGLGIMNPSDYGYAVGGSVRTTCLADNLNNYKTNSCYANDWLKASSGNQWLLSPYSSSLGYAFYVNSDGYVNIYSNVDYANGVWPVGYLSSNVTIYDGDGSINNPFKLSVN